jgi:hypothetical protein
MMSQDETGAHKPTELGWPLAVVLIAVCAAVGLAAYFTESVHSLWGLLIVPMILYPKLWKLW